MRTTRYLFIPQQRENVAVIPCAVRDPVRPAGAGFFGMKEDDESKGELRLIALFLVLLALVVLRFFRR
jgi:hypothetical protein